MSNQMACLIIDRGIRQDPMFGFEICVITLRRCKAVASFAHQAPATVVRGKALKLSFNATVRRPDLHQYRFVTFEHKISVETFDMNSPDHPCVFGNEYDNACLQGFLTDLSSTSGDSACTTGHWDEPGPMRSMAEEFGAFLLKCASPLVVVTQAVADWAMQHVVHCQSPGRDRVIVFGQRHAPTSATPMIYQFIQLQSDHGPVDTCRRKIPSLGKGTDPTDWDGAPWSANDVRPRRISIRLTQRTAWFDKEEESLEGVIKAGLAPTIGVAAPTIDAQGINPGSNQ